MVVTTSTRPVTSLPLETPSRRNVLSALLFDIDGTLVNSDPIHLAVFQELLLKEDGFNENQPIDEEFFRKWIAGRANSLITADFFPDWPREKQHEWSLRKEARFRQMVAATVKERQMPGLDKVRAWVDAKGLGKAAVTNAPRLNAEAMLTGIGYDDWFGKEYLIIGDECDKPKPDPCPYLTACQRLNVPPDQCIVFEDSPSGARAGVAAGAFVVGILSGQEEETLHNAGCHMIIPNFDDSRLWDYLATVDVTSLATPQQQ